MINEKIHTLSLPYRGQSKKVRVYVPAHEDGETFPVVYMTDGQNLFEDDTVKFGCWYTREAVRAEQKRSGKGAVIVGIHNDEGPIERTLDLTPRSIGRIIIPPDIPEDIVIPEPRGEEFDAFVINAVMPEIEARFPVKTGRENTAFCGSSSGGLQSFYTAMTHPELFCCCGALSPAFLLYDRDDLEHWLRARVSDCAELPFLYLYMGGADDLEREMTPYFLSVCESLESLCPRERLKKVVIPENKHHESAWAPIFEDLLKIFLA